MRTITIILLGLILPVNVYCGQVSIETAARFESWIGQPEMQLKKSWGEPSEIIDKSQSLRIIQYYNDEQECTDTFHVNRYSHKVIRWFTEQRTACNKVISAPGVNITDIRNKKSSFTPLGEDDIRRQYIGRLFTSKLISSELPSYEYVSPNGKLYITIGNKKWLVKKWYFSNGQFCIQWNKRTSVCNGIRKDNKDYVRYKETEYGFIRDLARLSDGGYATQAQLDRFKDINQGSQYTDSDRVIMQARSDVPVLEQNHAQQNNTVAFNESSTKKKTDSEPVSDARHSNKELQGAGEERKRQASPERTALEQKRLATLKRQVNELKACKAKPCSLDDVVNKLNLIDGDNYGLRIVGGIGDGHYLKLVLGFYSIPSEEMVSRAASVGVSRENLLGFSKTTTQILIDAYKNGDKINIQTDGEAFVKLYFKGVKLIKSEIIK